jgi:hypothetical protein
MESMKTPPSSDLFINTLIRGKVIQLIVKTFNLRKKPNQSHKQSTTTTASTAWKGFMSTKAENVYNSVPMYLRHINYHH